MHTHKTATQIVLSDRTEMFTTRSNCERLERRRMLQPWAQHETHLAIPASTDGSVSKKGVVPIVVVPNAIRRALCMSNVHGGVWRGRERGYGSKKEEWHEPKDGNLPAHAESKDSIEQGRRHPRLVSGLLCHPLTGWTSTLPLPCFRFPWNFWTGLLSKGLALRPCNDHDEQRRRRAACGASQGQACEEGRTFSRRCKPRKQG